MHSPFDETDDVEYRVLLHVLIWFMIKRVYPRLSMETQDANNLSKCYLDNNFPMYPEVRNINADINFE